MATSEIGQHATRANVIACKVFKVPRFQHYKLLDEFQNQVLNRLKRDYDETRAIQEAINVAAAAQPTNAQVMAYHQQLSNPTMTIPSQNTNPNSIFGQQTALNPSSTQPATMNLGYTPNQQANMNPSFIPSQQANANPNVGQQVNMNPTPSQQANVANYGQHNSEPWFYS